MRRATQPRRTWRDEIQGAIGEAMDQADRRGLTGNHRAKFIRRSMPYWCKASSWLKKLWQSEMRRLFGRTREKPGSAGRPMLLFMISQPTPPAGRRGPRHPGSTA